MSAAVEAHGLSKRYGDLVAVDELTFGVEAGEILGFLGPNGAGKTTAIRILTTILEPTGGTFAVAGISQDRHEEIRARIGVLPESAGYPERQTGVEFLRYHARLFGRDRSDARIRAARLLDDVGLGDRAKTPIASYSRGMRQRLGIARALVNDPMVVFLDEPTLGLDPAGQRQVLDLVRQIAAERGATVLLSTHLLAEVEETCSRVLILSRGRVVAEGTVAEVARRAAGPRTASVRVAPTEAEHAAALLGPLVVDRRGGSLVVALDGREPNDVLRLLLDGGLSIQSFELAAARLSDAFLAVTEAR